MIGQAAEALAVAGRCRQLARIERAAAERRAARLQDIALECVAHARQEVHL